MKTAKKALLLTVCALVLVAATIFGTVAFLTSDDEVVNTFTVGKLAMKLDEADTDEQGFGELLYVQEDGTLGTTQTDTIADRVKTNAYKLMPGHTYVKDPVVHLTKGSENCYVYVRIDNGLRYSGAAGEAIHAQIEEQMIANGWGHLAAVQLPARGDGQGSLEARLGDVWCKKIDNIPTDKDLDLATFAEFTVPGETDQTVLNKLDNTQIYVTAYACQQDGFNNTENVAKNALEAWNACFAK